jgi:hypothetical protein
MKMNKAERDKVIAKIEAAERNRRHSVEVFKSSHPQVKEMRDYAKGMADAYESVLMAFKGDSVTLNIWASMD